MDTVQKKMEKSTPVLSELVRKIFKNMKAKK